MRKHARRLAKGGPAPPDHQPHVRTERRQLLRVEEIVERLAAHGIKNQSTGQAAQEAGAQVARRAAKRAAAS